MEFYFTKWSMFPPCLQLLFFFMDYIISDYKNNIKYDFTLLKSILDYKSNIKYDFTLLESYFINNGKDMVPLFM